MVDDDHYVEALAAASLLGSDDRSHIGRRIANRLGRRTMFALDQGKRSRARLMVAKSQDHPSTTMSQDANAAYDAAQARATARAADRRAAAELAAQQEAAREEAWSVAEEAPGVPETSASNAPSGPSTTNWCGKRAGDGDGIYCE